MLRLLVWLLLIYRTLLMVNGAPQREFDEAPTPYNYQYKVENPPTNTFFGQNEAGDQTGRVVGSYYVYLPDGRLMTVEYLVDGDSGFMPKITFQDGGGGSFPPQG